jgi:hypothetical protein
MRKLLTVTLITLCLSSAVSANAAVKNPISWPDYLAMGTVTNFTDTVTTSFSGSDKLDFLFAYALYDNNGTIPTTAPLSSDMGPTNTIISQAQAISSQTQPVVVVYNLNLSVGLNIDGTGNKQYDPKDYDWDNQNQIQWGFENVILNGQALAKAKPTSANKYGAIILNPDFLGQIHTDNEEDYQFKNVNINKAVLDALTAEGIAAKDVPNFSNDVKGFIEANNYILSTYFTSVNYGWVVNTWAGGNANFVHGNSADVSTNVDTVNGILDETMAYSSSYKPDFIVFDKYEANDYSALTPDLNAQSTSNVINLGYLFNARDMHNYLSYIGGVSSHVSSPAVLWQIPGGHLVQSSGDKADPVTIGTEPDYIFGSGSSEYTPSTIVTDPAQAIPFLNSLNLNISMPAAYQYNGSIGNYLTMDQTGNVGKYDWTQPNTSELVSNNVVAVLWGGGSTTGMVDNIAKDRRDLAGLKTLSDGGWLMNTVQNYYVNPQKLTS